MKFDCILFRVEIYSASSGFGSRSSDCHSSLSAPHFPSLRKWSACRGSKRTASISHSIGLGTDSAVSWYQPSSPPEFCCRSALLAPKFRWPGRGCPLVPPKDCALCSCRGGGIASRWFWYCFQYWARRIGSSSVGWWRCARWWGGVCWGGAWVEVCWTFGAVLIKWIICS